MCLQSEQDYRPFGGAFSRFRRRPHRSATTRMCLKSAQVHRQFVFGVFAVPSATASQLHHPNLPKIGTGLPPMFFGNVVPPSATAGHLRHPNVPKTSAGPSPILCWPFLRFCRRPHAIFSTNVWVKLLRTILSLATRKRFSQLCPVRALLSDLNISDALCVLRERLSNWIETYPESQACSKGVR